MNRYETLSIAALDAIIARLDAALNRPNVSNRGQIATWIFAATVARLQATGAMAPVSR